MFRLLCTTLIIGLFAGTALAQPGMKSTGFAKLDLDGNGVVTWEEYSKAVPNMLRPAFDAMDADKDGKLTPEERGAFVMQHSQENSAKGMGGGMPPKGMKKGKPMLMPPNTPCDGNHAPGECEHSKAKPMLLPPTS